MRPIALGALSSPDLVLHPVVPEDPEHCVDPCRTPPLPAGDDTALESLALRQQLAIYKRTVIRPPLRTSDRLFWVGLARVWAGGGSPHDRDPSHRPAAAAAPFPRVGPPSLAPRLSTGGRPTVRIRRSGPWSGEWPRRIQSGVPPRIHAELRKLGLEAAERTVSRLLPTRRTQPSRRGGRSSPTTSSTSSRSIFSP
jgi:hypothetical protein